MNMLASLIRRRDFQRLILLAALLSPVALPAADSTNTTSSRPPFSTFKMLAERNIFNTKRSPQYVRTTEVATNLRPTRSAYVALVGIMSYEKGPFAFFEGSSSEFQKVLKQDDTIAGFKIGEIQGSSVKLISPSNQIELKVGMQLSRQDEGEWHAALRPENLDTRGTRSVATSWAAQPAAPRTEPSSQSQSDGGPFPFPGGAIPDQILQAIQGGLPRGVVLPGVNDQNNSTTTTIVVPAPSGGNGDSPEVILQRLIERRRQQENN